MLGDRLTVSVDVKHHVYLLNHPSKELRSCVKDEEDILDSRSLIVRTVSVEVILVVTV